MTLLLKLLGHALEPASDGGLAENLFVITFELALDLCHSLTRIVLRDEEDLVLRSHSGHLVHSRQDRTILHANVRAKTHWERHVSDY